MKNLIQENTVMIDRSEFKVYGYVGTGVSYSGFRRSVEALAQAGYSRTQGYRLWTKYEIKTRHQDNIRGDLTIRFTPSTGSIKISMTLKTNPTRLLRNKSFPHITAHSLDKKDNFLPQDVYRNHDRTLLSDAVKSILHKSIAQEISRVSTTVIEAAKPDVLVFSEPSISPQLIEFYFDLPFDAATLLVANNRRLFNSMFKRAGHKKYSTWSTGDDVCGNAYTLKAQPLKGEIMKIYPKDNDSVRFEVELNRPRIASIKGNSQFGRDFLSSLNDLIGVWFPKASQRVLEFIDKCTVQPSSTPQVFQEFFDLHRACKDSPQLQSVLSLLVANGKIEYADELKYVLKKLTDADVLTHPERGVYTVSRSKRQRLKKYAELCSEHEPTREEKPIDRSIE